MAVTFNELKKLIDKSRSGEPKFALNTTVRFVASTKIAIKLYNTDIVIVNSNDEYQIFTKDYDTKTTKDRIAKYTPVRLNTIKGVLCVITPEGPVPFCDGITVNCAGKVIGGCKIPSIAKQSTTKSKTIGLGKDKSFKVRVPSSEGERRS
jgi:hypothetical protein